MLINSTVLNFFVAEVFWCNFFRYFAFKLTGLSIPLSALYGAVALGFLAISIWRANNVYIGRSKIAILVSLIFITVSFLAAKFSIETGSNISAFGLKDLATLWSYTFFPAICITIGLLNSGSNLIKENRFTKLNIQFVLAGFLITTSLNVIDIIFYGPSLAAAYAGFATTAPAFFGNYTLSRLTGAYFSSLDFVFSAVALLFFLQEYKGFIYRISRFLVLLAILFTFTRNAYIFSIISFFVHRFGVPNQKKFNFLILSGIIGNIVSLIVMGMKLQSGSWDVSYEFSSIATRISSWLILIEQLNSSPLKMLFGLGVAQNYFGQAQVNIYAIDNMYLEILSLSGILGLIALIVILKNSLSICRSGEVPILLLVGGLITAAPIFGIFNNFLGWAMFSITLTVSFGVNRLSANYEYSNNRT